jgi:nitrous oxide reductase
LINPFSACTKVNTAFYDKILSDFDTNSYFVALDIKSSSYKGRVIIENNNLFQYLNKTKGLTREKYQSFMRRILVHHKVLKIDNKDFFASNFIKVSEVASVTQIANHGVNYFVANYFNGVVLNYGIPENERNAIINQLFYWDYPSKIETQSGNLIIG